MSKKIISLFEIYLIVMFSLSFAYMFGKTNDLGNLNFSNGETKFIDKLRGFLLNILSGGLVSAQSGSPAGGAIWTCQNDVNGAVCQEYPSNTCNSACTTPCFQGMRSSFANCKLGSCFDPVIGTCSSGTPKSLCEQRGGQWSNSTQAECNRECCLINPDGNGGGAQAKLTTQQQCNHLGQTLGAPISFVPVTGEIECLLKANSQERGACVLEFLPEVQKYNCETTTQSKCLASGGTFSPGHLCTNPSLNTKCERTGNTKCFKDLDGVYYIDSCNNRANIYDYSKLNEESYWNNIVPLTESCDVSVTGSSITNQANCGNCDYLRGSICGTPRSGTDTSANSGNYVCRDLSCVDEWGNRKRNGESWCAFDGKIGIDGSESPVPRTESIFSELPMPSGRTWCLDKNSGIATAYDSPTLENPNVSITQQSINIPTDKFTKDIVCSNDTDISRITARGTNEQRSVDLPGSRHYKRSCFDGEIRTEPCQEGRSGICTQKTQSANGYTSASCRLNAWTMCLKANMGEAEDLNKCEENADCFLKHVGINSFEFDMCVAKYPPGLYELGDSGLDANSICSYASQKCTYVEKKGLSGWKCIMNCGCKTQAFTESMNNLCSSLGDCGGKINLNGDFTHDGYSVRGRAPRLSENYISGMQSYKTSVQGQSATVVNSSQLSAMFGVPELNFEENSFPSTMAQIGLGAAIALNTGALGFTLGISEGVAAFDAAGEAITLAPDPSLGAFGTALTGAAVGAGIGYILATIFGLEGGAATAVVIVGAVVGLLSATGVLGAGMKALILNPTLIIVVVAIIIIFMILGIGKTRQRHVEFKCLPWQPPSGGAKCDLCNSGDLPCSKYKCETFGKTCRYLNEGTGNEVCTNIAPDDVAPPVIEVNDNVLSSGFVYNNPQTNGVNIKNNANSDGCLQEYTPVNWGILLNEPGQCKLSEQHTQNFDEMDSFFGIGGENNDYRINHSVTTVMPSLDEIGISGVDPNRKGDYNLYVRCQDASGNGKDTSEYTVKFCVSPSNDETPPLVGNFNPTSPGLVGLKANSKRVIFYTNEPATCKWSLTPGQDYSQMTNPVQCNSELNQATLNGWLCQTDLSVGNATTTDYYFKCADKPWLGNNETNPNVPDEERNVGEDNPYQLKKTATALNINYVSPNETIYVGSAPHLVDIEVRTTGGINNGNALCSFRESGRTYVSFFSTGSNVHEQEDLQLFPGVYNYQFECLDSAQNIANASIQFNIVLDEEGPAITRIYKAGTNLRVVTNEPSTCAWSKNACSFEFANGTALTGTTHTHTMPYENGINYKIKCKDSFGNIGTCMSVNGGY